MSGRPAFLTQSTVFFGSNMLFNQEEINLLVFNACKIKHENDARLDKTDNISLEESRRFEQAVEEKCLLFPEAAFPDQCREVFFRFLFS